MFNPTPTILGLRIWWHPAHGSMWPLLCGQKLTCQHSTHGTASESCQWSLWDIPCFAWLTRKGWAVLSQSLSLASSPLWPWLCSRAHQAGHREEESQWKRLSAKAYSTVRGLQINPLFRKVIGRGLDEVPEDLSLFFCLFCFWFYRLKTISKSSSEDLTPSLGLCRDYMHVVCRRTCKQNTKHIHK